MKIPDIENHLITAGAIPSGEGNDSLQWHLSLSQFYRIASAQTLKSHPQEFHQTPFLPLLSVTAALNREDNFFMLPYSSCSQEVCAKTHKTVSLVLYSDGKNLFHPWSYYLQFLQLSQGGLSFKEIIRFLKIYMFPISPQSALIFRPQLHCFLPPEYNSSPFLFGKRHRKWTYSPDLWD